MSQFDTAHLLACHSNYGLTYLIESVGDLMKDDIADDLE